MAEPMRLTVQGPVSGAVWEAVRALAAAAARHDGFAPFSEQAKLDMRYGDDDAVMTIGCWQGEELAGLAHLGPASQDGARAGELVVHPSWRRRGIGRALVQAVLTGAGSGQVRLWAHGDLPAAAALAATAGFTRARELWQMRAVLSEEPPEPRLPPGVVLRAFAPGRDEEQWVALNARAFASHPEQGRWTMDDLAHREREPWFDADGFLLAERGSQLAGFHWTKIDKFAGGASAGEPLAGQEPVGEVYVVGVDPGERGNGLGRALTLAGLRYLRAHGAPTVHLYVDGGNIPAIRLYEGLGFTRITTDVMYERRGQAT